MSSCAALPLTAGDCAASSDPDLNFRLGNILCEDAQGVLIALSASGVSPTSVPIEAVQVTWNACLMCAGEEGRAARVVAANFTAGGSKFCCNTVDANGSVHCGPTSSFLLLLGPLAVFSIALLIALLRASRRSQKALYRNRWWSPWREDMGVAIKPCEEGVAVVKQYEDDLGRARSTGQEASQAALARRLLSFCQPPYCDARAAIMNEWVALIGFQPDNAANQLEHLSSLIVSYGASNGGDYARAVEAAHAKLIGPVEKWRSHIGLTDTRGEATPRARKASPLVRLYGGGAGAHMTERCDKDKTYAGVATSAGPLSGWVRLSTSQQLDELCLYLLIWGEAANLRFMPELLHTIFELARTHEAANQAASGAFLRLVVQPVYQTIVKACTAKARTGHSYDTENYDDWNEAFWRRQRGLSDLCTADGIGIFAQPPPDRWACLLRADWERFLLTKTRKTHREMRWWSCLLAANRRVFLLHIITFVGAAAWTMPSIEAPSWDLGGWAVSTVVTVFWLLAPTCALLGRSFERWARNTVQSRARLIGAYAQMVVIGALAAYVLWLQSDISVDEFRAQSLGDSRWNQLVLVSSTLAMAGVLALYFELAHPTPPERDALDARPFYEKRLADIWDLRTRWFSIRRASGWPILALTPEVRDMLALNLFWLTVWGCKIAAARMILLPILLESHSQLVDAFPMPSDNEVESANSLWLARIQPRMLIRAALQLVVWGTGAAIYVADTLGWYQLVLSLWGGVVGISRYGVAPTRPRHFFGSVCFAEFKRRAYAKLLPSLAASEEEMAILQAGLQPKSQTLSRTSTRVKIAWTKIWHTLIDELYGQCLLSAAERDALRTETPITLQSTEAIRRLRFFSRSLESDDMPLSTGALQAAGISVLVPVYSEPILPQLPQDWQRELGVPRGQDQQHAHVLDHKTLEFLRSDFDLEWKRLELRLDDRVTFRSPFDRLMRVRTWAAERLQTVYRTVVGMMKHRKALDLLLEAELPTLNPAERQALLNLKFRLVLAVQTYANHHADATKSNAMDAYSRADVKMLLERFPHGLAVAYLQRVGDRFFSCVVDGTRRDASGQLESDPDHPELLRPTYRIELPGFPVLGNGKSDNQNMAIPYTRGPIIQAIDCNQEGYLEESLKICNVLREFDICIPGGGPPAIVGFREHIFSNLGTLGTFAATAELVFGTLVQRTLARPLWCRYHYGHPDVMDKLVLMAQGGLSKATKGLNLSEDIFAGMDVQLRGHNILHREYFQVGKGRDMGAISILQFFSKLSQGTAQMSTSRQALRLGQRLSLGRLLGFYYTHIGYYAGQLHYSHASYMMLGLAFVGSVVDAAGALPGVAAPCVALFNGLFGLMSLLFFAFNLLPSFFAFLTDEGPVAAVGKPLKALLTFSPLFFVMQSRCISHFFALEFAVGGAKYIPTGRGLAISHTPFHEIYATHAASCIYPGVELALLLAGTIVLAPLAGFQLNLYSVGFACIAPVALILGPSLFNPQAFCTAEGIDDLRRFLLWLVRSTQPGGAFDPRHSWADFQQESADAKRSVRFRAFLLPSKELVLSVPLLLASHIVMAPYGWGLIQLLLLGMPILSACAIGILLMPAVALFAALCFGGALAPAMAEASAFARLELLAALLVAVTLAAECMHWSAVDDLGFVTMPPSITLEHAILLAATRYFSFRWTSNAGLYLAAGLKRRAVEKRDGPPAAHTRACLHMAPDAIVYTTALTGAAHLFLVDALLGLSIHLLYLIISLVPGVKRGHYVILGFSRRVRATAEKQRGMPTTASALAWLAGKNTDARTRAAQRAAERKAEQEAQQAAAEATEERKGGSDFI